jgi:hypothetical protein
LPTAFPARASQPDTALEPPAARDTVQLPIRQAIAIRLDLSGADAYSCTGSCLRRSGDNVYHYDETGLFSFSAAIDLGGASDGYPEALPNDALLVTGAAPERSADAGCWGLVLDE